MLERDPRTLAADRDGRVDRMTRNGMHRTDHSATQPIADILEGIGANPTPLGGYTLSRKAAGFATGVAAPSDTPCDGRAVHDP